MNTREVRDGDWPRIAYLASDDVQEGDHTALDREWIVRRRDPSVTRYDFVLEKDGQVASYAALEKDPAFDGYRAFIVMDWSRGDQAIADASYRELERIAAERDIHQIWMRELAGDVSLIDYAKSQGFSIDRKYEYRGFELVNLSKSFGR